MQLKMKQNKTYPHYKMQNDENYTFPYYIRKKKIEISLIITTLIYYSYFC